MTTFNNRATGEQVELSSTDFDPGTHPSYGGSPYQFSKQNPSTGEWKRNSRDMATMMGQHAGADASLQIPTGSTTDFRAPDKSNHPAMQDKPQYWNFKPNAQENHYGAWN